VSQSLRPAARRATLADVPRLAGSLARAFRDDPVFRWLFPVGHSREERSAAFFTMALRDLHLRHDEVWTAQDGAAAALWDPPGGWRVPPSMVVRQVPTLLRLLGARTPLALLGLNRVETRHPSSPHWYLAVLGTDPSAQGQGLGSGVLAPVLEQCDADGVGAYLESSKERNIAFYARHGFRVTAELRLPRGPSMWAMWRDPRP
jgi:ribosomal protein S18 acetylase RimI-like enzyme